MMVMAKDMFVTNCLLRAEGFLNQVTFKQQGKGSINSRSGNTLALLTQTFKKSFYVKVLVTGKDFLQDGLSLWG